MKESVYRPLIIAIAICFMSLTLSAQNQVEVTIQDNGTSHDEMIDLPVSMTYPLDSLLVDWKAKHYIHMGEECSTSPVNPTFSDSIYIDRLQRMPTIMEMPYLSLIHI